MIIYILREYLGDDFLKDLKELPRISDSISFIYIEYARIEQNNFAIKAVRENIEVSIPITNFCTLFLGPGTSITHQAVKICAENGVLIIWCSGQGSYFYAGGNGETKKGANLIKQVNYYSDDTLHLEVVRRMYQLRFSNIDMTGKNITQMRGIEGNRVKSIYSSLSKAYGVKWFGRSTGRENWNDLDLINKAITYGNSILYGVAHSVIFSLGFSPTLGFIHTGTILSFVYDIADLYKMETVVPTAFKIVSGLQNKKGISEEYLFNLLRRELYFYFSETKLLKNMVKDLLNMFDEGIKEVNILTEEGLWDIDNIIKGNRNFGDIG